MAKAKGVLFLLGCLLPWQAWGGEARRFTARLGAGRESYSFAPPGSAGSFSIEDRGLHGWRTQWASAYARRFAQEDLDLGLAASHAVPWRKASAGFSLGGATRHALLPAFRAGLNGGLSLGLGFAAEAEASYRHYDSANVYIAAPRLLYYWKEFVLVGGYTLSKTYYTTGGDSGGLSSFMAKLAWSGLRIRPWISYARSKEPFEAGRGVVQSFRADHYSGGAAWSLSPEWEIEASFSHEKRLPSNEHVNTAGLGLAYSWGELN